MPVRVKGATLINLAQGQSPNAALRKMAPHLVLNATPDMLVSQREIFGPILPVRTYRDKQEVADYVNGQDRPLAIYPFTHDKELQQFYISRVMSGGVSVNEGLLHVGQHDLPFGGVGPSGMGAYHGHDGFKTFSHAKSIYHQPKINVAKLAGFMPPYSDATRKTIARDLKV